MLHLFSSIACTLLFFLLVWALLKREEQQRYTPRIQLLAVIAFPVLMSQWAVSTGLTVQALFQWLYGK